jgi:acyl-CoA thioesterase FadM
MSDSGSAILTKWPVLQEHTVASDDLDVRGQVGDAAVERWAVAARSANLERCSLLQTMRERCGLDLRIQTVNRPSGAALGCPTTVIVTTSAPEVRSRSIVVAARIRPIGGSGVGVNGDWVIQIRDPNTGCVYQVTDDIRDELIHLERSAGYWN